MLNHNLMNDTIEAENISDLLETQLCSGRVFSVYASPMYTRGGRCLTIRVQLSADEGHGQQFSFFLANNQVDSIPVQVELALMEIDCLPTWIWDLSFTGAAYQCQFARSHNPKVVSDSGAYRFPRVL